MRKAKIVCTIGPSSSDIKVMERMIMAGMNVARVNMSHGTHEGHEAVIKNLRKASENTGKEIAILMDLQGPKIRVDKLDQPLELSKGDHWYIGEKKYFPDNEKFIPTIYKNLVKDCQVGAQILFDDGLLEAKVIEKGVHLIKVEVVNGGLLKSNKGINLPNTKVSAPSLTEKDKEDLVFGLKQDIDFIALSFVRNASDIIKVKKILKENNKQIPIISKIEKPEAITNIEEILKESDGLMIARGDMAVEVGTHLVPKIQKQLIILANQKGKPVITATQMLESMTQNMYPTRAEASDVANSVWDGTDALMLSGETASGINPVNVIETMTRIIEEAETLPKKRKNLLETKTSLTSNIQLGATLIAEKIESKAILSFSKQGVSTQRLSSCRPSVKILSVTDSLSAARRMCLMWGVSPVVYNKMNIASPEEDKKVLGILQDNENWAVGDTVVVVRAGGREEISAVANSIKIEVIGS